MPSRYQLLKVGLRLYYGTVIVIVSLVYSPYARAAATEFQGLGINYTKNYRPIGMKNDKQASTADYRHVSYWQNVPWGN